MTRAAGYIRVSTVEQVDSGWNLAEDRALIESRCEAEGWELTAIYDDGGRQGDDPDRPGLLALLGRLDEVDVVIMRQQDRISRDPVIWGTVSGAFIAARVRVVTFTGEIDLDTPQGRFMAGMMAQVGKLEKEQIGQRVRQAKSARAKAGGHPGGGRAFGYRLRDLTAEGTPTGPLTVDPVEAAVVVRMFQMAMTTSQRQIAHILNAEHIVTSRGGLWHQSVVARVLSSPLYLGKIRRKVDGEWEIHDGQHDAIVDEALWERVNRSRATPQRREGGRPLTSGHLLTRGILRCGSCGSAMIPYALRDRSDTYRCAGRHQHGTDFCGQTPVRRDVIDEALLEQLTSRYFDLDGARERIRARQASELPLARAAVTEAQRELAQAEARIAKVTRGWQDDVIGDEEYALQRAALDEERAGAHEAVEQAQGRVDSFKNQQTTTDAEEGLLRHLADLKEMVVGTVSSARDVEGLRTVVRQLFASVELCGPEHPFGQGADGVLIPEGDQDPMVGSARLLIRMRPEMVDWQAWKPIKSSLPEQPTPPPCRTGQFLDAIFAPIPLGVGR